MTRTKGIQWLYNQLPMLTTEGILSTETAQKLRDYYGVPEDSSKRSLGLIICSIIGAVLIGLGIILLLAHNWENLSRFQRTLLSFAPLVAGQVLAGMAFFRHMESTAWCESAALFLMASIGSSIALVGQTYHISGNLENFILAWMALSIPMVYLLRSTGVAVFSLIGLTSWLGVTYYYNGNHFLFWILFAVLTPHIWSHVKHNVSGQRAAFLCWTVAICLLIVMGITLDSILPRLWFVVFLTLLSVYYLVNVHWFNDVPSSWQRPFGIISCIGIPLISLALTYDDVWRHLGGRYTGIGWFSLRATPFDYTLITALLMTAIVLMVTLVRQKKFMHIVFAVAPFIAWLSYFIVTGSDRRGATLGLAWSL